jgi:cobalt-precorrin 5A hydrolase
LCNGLVIVAGFGFRGAAGGDSLANAYAQVAAGLPIAVLATADDKASSAAFREFAAQLALPVIAIDSVALGAQDTLTQSGQSHAARGTGSVAEAAALAAAGPGARLIMRRVISTDRMATCAVAQSAPSRVDKAKGDGK